MQLGHVAYRPPFLADAHDPIKSRIAELFAFGNEAERAVGLRLRPQDYTRAAATHRESDFDTRPAIVGWGNRGIETGIDDRSLTEQLAPPSGIALLSCGLFHQFDNLVAHASGELQG